MQTQPLFSNFLGCKNYLSVLIRPTRPHRKSKTWKPLTDISRQTEHPKHLLPTTWPPLVTFHLLHLSVSRNGAAVSTISPLQPPRTVTISRGRREKKARKLRTRTVTTVMTNRLVYFKGSSGIIAVWFVEERKKERKEKKKPNKRAAYWPLRHRRQKKSIAYHS